MLSHNRWRAAPALALLAIGSLALGACSSGGGGGGGDETTITFMPVVSDNLSEELWSEIISGFEEENPNITVELVSPAGQEYVAYARTLLASGNFPDVLLAQNPDLAQQGALQPLNESFVEGFNNYEDTALDGEYYYVPTAVQPQSLIWYNEDLFAQAGIDEVPTDPDSFAAALESLAAVTEVPFAVTGEWTTGYQFGVMTTPTVMSETPDWFAQRNAGEAAFVGSYWQDAAAQIAAWNAAGYLGDGALSKTFDQGGQEFIAGESATYPMGVWFGATLDAAELPFEAGVFAAPSATGEPTISAVLSLQYGISATTESQEAAEAFLTYLTRDEDAVRTQLEADGLFSNAVEPVDYERGAVLTKVADLLGQSQLEFSSANGLGNSVPPPGFSDTLNTTAQSVLLGELDGEGYAAALDAWWDANQ